MYFYRISCGEYEQYCEYTFWHKDKFSEEEFIKMAYEPRIPDWEEIEDFFPSLTQKYGFICVDNNLHIHRHID